MGAVLLDLDETLVLTAALVPVAMRKSPLMASRKSPPLD
jgi:hypothetical protein